MLLGSLKDGKVSCDHGPALKTLGTAFSRLNPRLISSSASDLPSGSASSIDPDEKSAAAPSTTVNPLAPKPGLSHQKPHPTSHASPAAPTTGSPLLPRGSTGSARDAEEPSPAMTSYPAQQHVEDPTAGAAGESGIDRNAIIQQAVGWSVAVAPEFKLGAPAVHRVFADVFWQEGSYTGARYHFMLCTDGETTAQFLVEFQQSKGYPSEVDLFITQAVLQYLSRDNEPTAAAAFHGYTRAHPDIRGRGGGPPFPAFPLLDFLWLLLLCVRETPRRVARFMVLVELYQPSLARDPSYTGYLDRIGQLYFGVPPPGPEEGDGGGGGGGGMGGFIGNILSSLLGDGDEPSTGGSAHSHHLGNVVMDDLD